MFDTASCSQTWDNKKLPSFTSYCFNPLRITHTPWDNGWDCIQEMMNTNKNYKELSFLLHTHMYTCMQLSLYNCCLHIDQSKVQQREMSKSTCILRIDIQWMGSRYATKCVHCIITYCCKNLSLISQTISQKKHTKLVILTIKQSLTPDVNNVEHTKKKLHVHIHALALARSISLS